MKLHHRLIAVIALATITIGTVYTLLHKRHHQISNIPKLTETDSIPGNQKADLDPGEPSSSWHPSPSADTPPMVLRTGDDGSPQPVIIAPSELIFGEPVTPATLSEVSFPPDPTDTIKASNNRPDPNDVPARKIREADALIDQLLDQTPPAE